LTISEIPPEIAIEPTELMTDGELIYWTSASDGAATIHSWDPRSSSAEVVYQSDDSTSVIWNMAVGETGYVFAEGSYANEEGGTWSLRYLPRNGAEAVTLDKNDLPFGTPGILPAPAIDRDWVVWAATHAGPSDPLCELRAWRIESESERTLASGACGETEYWFPAVRRGELVFGTVEYGPHRDQDDRHVYRADLQSGDLQFVQLDADGEASMPAIGERMVVWKTAPREYNMLNWGHLVRYDEASRQAERLLYQDADSSTVGRPWLGDGYLVADYYAADRLVVFVVADETELVVEPASSTTALIHRARLAGRLLVWLHADDTLGTNTRISWTVLP
jgi:hypothetical protein